MTKLEMAIATAEIYRDLNASDCSVLITNAEGIIVHYTEARTFAAKVTIGTTAPGGAVKQCIATKKIVHTMIPEQAYGVRLRSIVTPIFEENGELSGAIGMAISLQTGESLRKATKDIATTTEVMTATAQEIAVAASTLAEELAKAKCGTENVLAEINKTDDILRFVSDVAANSNLLGLNAAIEAARAGEHGRGFAVVADEIRKMAVNSAQSVKDIRTILQSIHGQTKLVVDIITNTAELGERQAAATEEIGASMEQLSASTNEIGKIASSI